MQRPRLPPDIEVLDGTDVEAAWEQFHLFEALHYGLRLCNPFTLDGLTRVVAALAPHDGDRMLDLGCGHGELLIQAAERAAVEAVGVDLSPWALMRAHRAAGERGVGDRIRWVLGDAREFGVARPWDVVSALGVPWLWGGFEGTVRATVERAVSGGRIAVGDLQLRAGVEEAPDGYDPVLRRDEQVGILDESGLTDIIEIVPDEGAWQAHDARMTEAVERYAAEHPGEQAQGFRRMHTEWIEDHAGDPDSLTWTVWVARRA